MSVLDWAARSPDAIAVDDGTRRRSWSELADRAQRIAHLLRDEWGLGPGDHLAQLVGNRVEFVELSLASLFAGTWLTPVNWHLAADEVEHVLEDSGSRVLFCDPELDVAVPGRAGVEVVEVGAALDALVADTDDAPVDLGSPAGGNMFYTSGTTGRPKGVKRRVSPTVADALGAAIRYGDTLGLVGGGPHLVTGPLYHAAPLGFAVMDLHHGAPLILMPRFDPERMLRLVADRGVVDTHLVPTMMTRLLRLPDDARATADVDTLRLVLHGAAPVVPSTKRAMIDWWGPVFVEYWGASEGGVVTLISSEDWLAHPGSVGRATANHEVFAADEEGMRLPAGEEGLLWCRNRAVADVFEYHNDPAKTAASFREPGVYTLGDIGRVDEEGYVWLTDRKSHMIISGGVNIYPAEVERVLHEHEAVADVAVFGVPDDEWGESVKAAIELRDGYAQTDGLAEDILRFGRERLAGYKVPRSVDFHDRLPRYDSGKIFTRRLKAEYWPA